jgi:hypothetical protein
MRDIFETLDTPEEQRLREEVLGGYPIAAKPIPEGYGESVGDPDYIGTYAEVVKFFEELEPNSRKSYHRVAEFVWDHPGQESMGVGIFGFDATEHALWLAKGLDRTDPERRSVDASKFILDQVGDLEVWVDTQAANRIAPMLTGVLEGREMPDTRYTAWDRHTGVHYFGRNAQDFQSRAHRGISIVREFIDDPETHPYLLSE